MNSAEQAGRKTVGIGVAVTVLMLFASLFLPKCKAVAAMAAPAPGVITPGFDSHASLHISMRGTKTTATIVRPEDCVWGDSGRYLMAIENLRTADARSDITSVKAGSTMVSDGSGEKGADNYLDKTGAGTAVLSTDAGKAMVGRQASNVPTDGLVPERDGGFGMTLHADDFVAHTREYLQTKK